MVDIKAEVDALRTDSSRTGITGGVTPVVPSLGNIPANTSLSGSTLTVTGAVPLLSEFDFTNHKLKTNPGAVLTEMLDCTIGVKRSLGTGPAIDVTSGEITTIRRITADGGDGPNAASVIHGHGVKTIERCKFLNLSDDAIKPGGNASWTQLIQLNYFGRPRAFPNVRALYSAATTYNDDDGCLTFVSGSYYAFRAKVNGLLGVAPPAGGTSDSNWEAILAHPDQIQFDGSLDGPMDVRHNYFDFGDDGRAWGLTTSLFVDPHSTRQIDHLVRAYENIFDSAAVGTQVGYTAGRPISIGGASNVHNVRPQIYNNWLKRHTADYDMAYMLASVIAPTDYGANWDLDTDALLAIGHAELPSGGLYAMTSPTLGIDWAGGGSPPHTLPGSSLTINVQVDGSVPVSGLTYPAPTYDVWDFDHTTAAWDTDTIAATESALESAIATAMADAGTVPIPRYHRIEWTGGVVAGSWALTSGASAPTKNTVFILIEPTSVNTSIAGGITVGAGISDVKFSGFQIEPTSAGFAGGLAQCIKPTVTGGRMAFEDCRFGAYWRGGAVSTFPEVIGGSSLSNWEITIKNCDARDIYQFCDARAGYYHFEDTFITGLVDDFVAMTVRNVAPNICYLYAIRNVLTDFADSASHSGYHPDFIQTGVPADTASDTYEIQAYGNVMIGDTYQQYPTHFGIIQNEGAASGITQDVRDNVMLATGLRGWWTVDKTLTFERNFMAWPPLGGAVPTALTGWTGGPYSQNITPQGNLRSGGTTDISNYVAGANATAGAWTPANPDFIVDHKASLGGANAYDTRFPAMTGLSFSGATLLIDNNFSSTARTRAAIRQWVEDTYAPTNAANVGWVANGFNLPSSF